MNTLRQQILFLLVACLSTFFSMYLASSWNFLLDGFSSIRLAKTLMSCLFNYSLILLFAAVLRRQYTALVLSQIFAGLIEFINFKKEKYLSTNFSPDDILLFSEAFKAAPMPLKVAFFAFIVVFLTVLIFCFRKEKATPIKTYVVQLLLSAVMFCSAIYMNYIKSPIGACSKPNYPKVCLTISGFPNTRSDWIGDFRKIQNFGFTTFFMSKILDNLTETFLPHETVSRETIEQIFKPLETPTAASEPASSTTEQPNIVVVMDESMWNPRLLDKKLPKNLTPFTKQNQVSALLSPSFGGGTANVEFEALTSLNTIFFRNELVYVAKIRKPIYSLPLYLNSLGYDTIAMHNNWRYYYNRNRVYQSMGFHKFISLENMMNSTNRSTIFNQAGWANDDVIFNSIKTELSLASDQPKFIYAITVENHPMYSDDRYGAQSYKLNPNLSESAHQKMATYTAGVARADQHIRDLTAYVKTLKRPTIVIAFGDHLPNLQNVYDEYHYFDQDPNREEPNAYETPLVLWSNYPVQRKVFAQPFIPASFLAPKILHLANLPLSPYYQFIEQVSSCYDAIHQKFIREKASCKFNKEQLLEQYKSLNNDTLNGHNFTYQMLKPKSH